MTDIIPIADLAVVTPGDFDHIVVEQLGVARKALMPEVTAAAAALSSALDALVADAAADIAPQIASLGYMPPIAYAVAIDLTSTRQTVEYLGHAYAPLQSALPFTTSGTFEIAKFRLIQGVVGSDLSSEAGAAMVGLPGGGSLADLGTATGAALVGFMQGGTGAVLRPSRAKIRELAVTPQDFGAVGDYVRGIGGTDDTLALQKAIAHCIATRRRLVIPTGSYLVNATLNLYDINVEGEDAYGVFICANTAITILKIRGSRREIKNLNVWFDMAGPAPATAIGVQFGTNEALTAADQFSNNVVQNLYVRYAYDSYACNSAGVTGTLWNNTFINCRSDLQVRRGWNFAAIVGSTTQTWINCMIDGVTAGGADYPAEGWYTSNIDDVAWFNCQADDMYDGRAIYVDLASSAVVQNFRCESSYFRTNGAQLIYLNAPNSDVSNVKLQASTVMVGAGNRASVVRFGTNGSGVVGNIAYETNTLESGTIYKVDSNGTQFGRGRVTIMGAQIARADVRRDDVGERTVFSNKIGKYGSTGADPTAGTFEIGDQMLTVALSLASTEYGRLCVVSGTAGTLASVTATTTAGSALVTANSTANLREGNYITIAGVAGIKRIVHLRTSTQFYIDAVADAAVSSAAVAYSPPTFKSLTI